MDDALASVYACTTSFAIAVPLPPDMPRHNAVSMRRNASGRGRITATPCIETASELCLPGWSGHPQLAEMIKVISNNKYKN
jgi:hypothetical protein